MCQCWEQTSAKLGAEYNSSLGEICREQCGSEHKLALQFCQLRNNGVASLHLGQISELTVNKKDIALICNCRCVRLCVGGVVCLRRVTFQINQKLMIQKHTVTPHLPHI